MFTIALLLVVGVVASNAFEVQVGQVYRFRSKSFPKRWLHQRKDALWIDAQGSSFLVVQGLIGRGISFRSIESPGQYIRHNAFKCFIEKPDGTKLFKNDASFIPVKGLDKSAGSVSFQSVNYERRYIRNTPESWTKGPKKFRSKQFRIQVREGNLDKGDASWLPKLVFGKWGKWKTEPCSKTCGGGVQKRIRVCKKKPAPKSKCNGPSADTVACNTQECPVNGNWGDWGAYGECSKTCGGGGVQERKRTCNNPPPAKGGKPCDGSNTETQACGADECPINGNWGNWGDYGTCTTTCGDGVLERTRECNNPAPSGKGAKSCEGSAKDSKPCNLKHCPVNGEWSSWGEYGHCSKFCGSGIIERTRTCTNPAPDFEGDYCPGEAVETKPCNIVGDQCPGMGMCYDLACERQHEGAEKVTASTKEECLKKCKENNSATGCEWQGDGKCLVHTAAISRGAGSVPFWQKHISCWVFSKCKDM